jgi:hypothetical protein
MTFANFSLAMFYPKENPGYYSLSEDAKNLIVQWPAGTEWYESSSEGA